MNRSEAVREAHLTLAAKSKSFALAGRLLRPGLRDEMAVLYAYCRHVDDAVDCVPRAERAQALDSLRRELDAVYSGESPATPLLGAFAWLVHLRRIPRSYPEELLSGMAMDVAGARYQSLDELELYCFRVAGVVGLMACHVMGVSDPGALRRAAHLGMAMQLTNVCRDVEEDLNDGRVYLPSELLGSELTSTPPTQSAARQAVRRVVAQLLSRADMYYQSADRGLSALDFRSSLAIRVARHVYAAIGSRLRKRSYDPFAGRAFVPLYRKLWLVLFALGVALCELPRRLLRDQQVTVPERLIEYPHDILPV